MIKTRDMDKKRIGAGFFLLGIFFMVNGQVIRSERAFLPAKPKQAETRVAPAEDMVGPEITLMSPSLGRAIVYETNKPEMPIFGTVTDNRKVLSLVINSEFVDLSNTGQFTKRVDLFPGENSFIVEAWDESNNHTEKRFIVNYTPVKVSLAEKTSKESVYYALIIGINNYSDPALNDLDNAVRDAENFRDVLTSKYTFDKNNITFIKDARREEIIIALDHLARQVTEDDNLLIYYAGHGHYDEDAQIGYWLPSNARKITTADWFGNSQLVDYLRQIDSKHTLLVTDACFSGSIFKTRTAFSDAPPAIEKLYELPSRKAMTSGTLTEVPDESSFAKFLIERLEKNRDQYYTAEQLFSSIKIAVINNSDAIPKYGEIQNVGDEGGDFIFIHK